MASLGRSLGAVVVIVSTLAMSACESLTPSAVEPLTSASPSVAVDEGFAAPEALRDVRCERDASGRWAASGAVLNGSTVAREFRVRVQVGPPVADVEAREVALGDIAPDGRKRFVLDAIPTRSDEGPCHVQVAVLN